MKRLVEDIAGYAAMTLFWLLVVVVVRLWWAGA